MSEREQPKPGDADEGDEPANDEPSGNEEAADGERVAKDKSKGESDSKNDGASPQQSVSSGRSYALYVAIGIGVVLGGIGLYLKLGKPQPTPASGDAAGLLALLDSRGHAAGAKAARDACAADADCSCGQALAHAALDADLHAEALAQLTSAKQCEKEPVNQGMRAEALARGGNCEDAQKQASAVAEPPAAAAFAHYALAHCANAQGDAAKAKTEAELSAEKGRGVAAHLLLGVMSYRAEDLPTAEAQFRKILTLDPNSVDAHYNLALIAQRKNRYRDAREGYLKVLQLAPKHADARFNLGVLTHSIGASAEAQHHLARLKEVTDPGDSRVARLEELLKTPPPSASK